MAEARRYVRAIRNDRKRRYAEAYLAYLQGGVEPDREVYGLTVMGAQAVQLQLAALDRTGTLIAR